MSTREVPSFRPASVPALVVLLAIAAAGASPTFAATLGVDDASATGFVGDARLSLGEAIRLAGGQLSLVALSDAERAHVDGAPGASSADLIRVELGAGATLATPAGVAFGLPALVGNEGDVLDGGGAVLHAAGPLPAGAIGLLTLSSEIEVRRFSFEGYPLGLVVAGTPGAADLEDIRISENRFSDYDSGLVVVPNPNGSKGLRGLLIERNRFVAGPEATNAIVVIGGSPDTPGAVASDYGVEDVVIRQNTIRGGNGGIAVFGGMARPGTTVRNGRLDGLRIVGNDARGLFDLSIAVFAGFANRGGTVSGIELSDVLIAGNRIASDGTPSTHIWVVAGTTFDEPGGLVENNRLHDVTITRNRTSGGGECSGGIQLQASQNELGGGAVRANLLDLVVAFSNSVSGCRNGLGVFAGVAAAGHGLVEGNELRRVFLFGNHLTNNGQSVNLIAGVGVESSAAPLPSSEPAAVRENLLHAVGAFGNHIRGGIDAILAIGGASNSTSDAVTGNVVEDSRESGNFVRDSQRRCTVFGDLVLGDEGGVATDNRAEFDCSKARPAPGHLEVRSAGRRGPPAQALASSAAKRWSIASRDGPSTTFSR